MNGIANMEIWKNIPGYPNYQASNLGNIRSLNFNRTGKTLNLKPILNNRGYLQVRLFLNGKFKNYGIHVLVAMAFLEHVPDGHNKIVDHRKKGTQLNNRLENLQIITQRINTTKDKVRNLPTGVYFYSRTKKYLAKIYINRKYIYLGYFTTPEEASQAYQNKLKEINNA
jgi:hypothetical protein